MDTVPTSCPDPLCKSRRADVQPRFQELRPGAWSCWHCGETISHSCGTARHADVRPANDDSAFAVEHRRGLAWADV